VKENEEEDLRCCPHFAAGFAQTGVAGSREDIPCRERLVECNVQPFSCGRANAVECTTVSCGVTSNLEVPLRPVQRKSGVRCNGVSRLK
jgi:hypothetical protein